MAAIRAAHANGVCTYVEKLVTVWLRTHTHTDTPGPVNHFGDWGGSLNSIMNIGIL